MLASIGLFDWAACRECRHCDEDLGGCDVDDDTFRDGINFDGDMVVCECFEKPPAYTEPETLVCQPRHLETAREVVRATGESDQ